MNKEVTIKINELENEIKLIWTTLTVGSVMVLGIWWGIEPMMRIALKDAFDEGGFATTFFNIVVNYIIGGMYGIGYIMAIVAIFMKKRAIRKYKKEKDVPSKINIQKDDISQNPVYVIDYSKDKPNQYEKGDRDMMKRVFNQNNNVSTDSGKENTSKTKSKGGATRSYNGSTRSSNSTESNNIALGIALESSTYSTGQDNDCSSSNNSSNSSPSSDYSSDGGSSCD